MRRVINPSHNLSKPEIEHRENQQALAKLVGNWTLSGTIGGKRTVHSVRAVSWLHGNYVRLEERSQEVDSQGRPAYEATVYVGWNSHTLAYVCTWLDSTAVEDGSGSCTGQPAPNAMPFIFCNGAGDTIIATTFTYHPSSDKWDWAIDNLDASTRTPFARVVLTRSKR